MKNYQITQLFFWTWLSNFANAISQDHLHLDDLLSEKLDKELFFYKVCLDVFPSYNFWLQIEMVLHMFTAYVSLDSDERSFVEAPVEFLKKALVKCLERFQYYPQMFRDFWRYYPRYNLSFDNIECIYLDFYFELPKVIDSLLSELKVRNAPLQEKILADQRLVALEATGLFGRMNPQDVNPPVVEGLFSEEALREHILEYLSGEDSEKVFLQVTKFYLNSRPNVKKECSLALEAKGLPIVEDSLIRYFLGEHIFKGVSNEAKLFFVSNLNLKGKNPFSQARKGSAQVWHSFSEERRQKLLKRFQKDFEEGEARVKEKYSLTAAERIAEFEEARKKVLALDLESLPKVSLNKFIEDKDKGFG